MRTYKEILSQKNPIILITGDSLAFNRYGYDPLWRGAGDAFDYGVGMQSWSFALRDRIYFMDSQFVFGDALSFDCDTVSGIDSESPVPNIALFDGKIKTIYPKDKVTFNVNIKSEEIVLYLQHRTDNPSVFDICVDGKLIKKDIDTKGDPSYFAGYSMLQLRLPCNADMENHEISFQNIRGENPKITVAGVGAVYKNIVLNGRGSQCIRFFIENFEERIARHKPDLILLSIIANDRGKNAPTIVASELKELLSMIFGSLPECKLLLLLPPFAHRPSDIESEEKPYTSIRTAELYDRVAEKVCADFKGQQKCDVDIMRISDLFDKDDVSSWRFDNIHLNKQGNKMLLDAIMNRLMLK